eukprot:gb/GECH01011617.1/.p1 GENE.gb/GECH01011617.1/~~gb/GECH01011617.1/.p1  ORF type:complete len:194 (+),score=29.47 gb/GECH01011617.1/:1-582(+)
MSKQILMLVGDFASEFEVIVPCQTLQAAGHEVHLVCPSKKPGDYIRTAVHELEGYQTYSEKMGHQITITHDFDSIELDIYDGLIIPGGRSPEYLRLNDNVLKIAKYFNDNRKPIACSCHGIQVLTAVNGLLKNRKCTGYPNSRPEVELTGADFQSVPFDEAVVDSNLVTAPTWNANPKYCRMFLELLGTKFSK